MHLLYEVHTPSWLTSCVERPRYTLSKVHLQPNNSLDSGKISFNKNFWRKRWDLFPPCIWIWLIFHFKQLVLKGNMAQGGRGMPPTNQNKQGSPGRLGFLPRLPAQATLFMVSVVQMHLGVWEPQIVCVDKETNYCLSNSHPFSTCRIFPFGSQNSVLETSPNSFD